MSHGDVLLSMWRSGATSKRIAWVNDRAVELIERSPRGIVAAQFLLPSATPPGLGEVGAVRVGLKQVLPRARRLVVVPEGDAAWQSVVRAVMRAGLAILGQSELIRVAASRDSALSLLSDVASVATPPMGALVDAHAALSEALSKP